jgi:3-deoxy-manno-octulosonate cytidylyltransferase (CMP-KDO synthetase)
MRLQPGLKAAGEFVVVIPARYAATRLPGKPLVDLCGQPMILRVLSAVRRSGARQIIVATDHPQVAEVVTAAGGEVCMTRLDHSSGTARLAEVVSHYQWADETIIVNVQGDEPLMPPVLIQQVAQQLMLSDAAVATLAAPLQSMSALWDPNVVKVVTDRRGYALYFSRAAIPWDRHRFNTQPQQDQQAFTVQQTIHGDHAAAILAHPCYQQHIGIYAYRAAFIRRYSHWTASPLEQLELLEQLRILWQGEKIQVALAQVPAFHGVDTPEDLFRVRHQLTTALPA